MNAHATVLFVFLAACTVPASDDLPQQAVAYIPSRENPTCAIVRVIDGDTLEIGCRTSRGNTRLVGFDTPETFRPGCAAEKRLGEKAKVYLTRVLQEAQIIAPQVSGKDRYGRTLVRLEIDGMDLATTMVSAGYAVYYSGGKRIDWCARLNR